MPLAVSFAWNANPPSDNVIAYIINRGTVTGNYTVAIPVGLALTGIDTLTVSGQYFWAGTAQNLNGISTPSSEITETVTFPPSGSVALVGAAPIRVVDTRLQPRAAIHGSSDVRRRHFSEPNLGYPELGPVHMKRVFHPLSTVWFHPSGAVYTVIMRRDGLLDWKLVRDSDGVAA